MSQFEHLPDFDDHALQVKPLARSETIPSSWYTDPAFHAFDRDAIFSRSWQYVGGEDQIPASGDFMSGEVAGNPVVVVRQDDSSLRAFYNVCRHRGGPLVTAGCGHTRMLQCQYHGWTYRRDGALRGVPRFDRTELFDRKDHGLVPLRVTTRERLVFVSLDADPAPIETLSEGIPERIAPIRIGTLRFQNRTFYDAACNWKVYVDNFLEGYHLPLVHPELCDVLDMRSYITETYPHYSLQYSPIKDGDSPYGPDAGAAFYYFIFPNFMLNILPGRVQVNRVIPVGADRCRVLFDYYYAEGTAPDAIASDQSFSDRVQHEDIGICEHVQRGLSSRGYDKGRFSTDAESGVYHFQTLLKAAYLRRTRVQGAA